MTGPLLRTETLTATYGAGPVLHGLSVEVDAGEQVAVVGANGAGKTTLLRAICGMCSTTGAVILDGDEVSGAGPRTMMRRGVAHVPQGRGTFPDLTVEENLRLGGFRRPRKEVNADLGEWYEVFPRLGERRHQAAGTLSGGEQQMLAIARGLIGRPRLLLLDEPSLGLAPIVVDLVFETLERLASELRIAMLIVEQNTVAALSFAQRGYVLEAGEVVAAASSPELLADDSIRRAYLGV